MLWQLLHRGASTGLGALPSDNVSIPASAVDTQSLVTFGSVLARFPRGHRPYPAASWIYPVWTGTMASMWCSSCFQSWKFSSGLNFLLVVPGPRVSFSKGLWFFTRFLSSSVKLELLRLVLVESVGLYHTSTWEGSQLKMWALYLGESFPSLSVSSLRAKPACGSRSCHTLWRGKPGKQRLCILLELLCQHRAGTVEGEHLQHTMNCTILFFLKQSFHALSQQRDRSRGCSWLGARLHPTAGGPHTPGAWSGSQHSSQSLFWHSPEC